VQDGGIHHFDSDPPLEHAAAHGTAGVEYRSAQRPELLRFEAEALLVALLAHVAGAEPGADTDTGDPSDAIDFRSHSHAKRLDNAKPALLT
jgi:hypothetical protein